MKCLPTAATGARSQRPTQGAGITRTSSPSAASSSASSRSAPNSAQLRLSHTRTVSGGGAVPSSATSKWW